MTRSAKEPSGRRKAEKQSAGGREATPDALLEAARYGGTGLDGFAVADSGDDDPVLVTPEGWARDAWREDYPYDNKLGRRAYEKSKRALQIELLSLQHWVKERDERIVILERPQDRVR